MPYFSYTCLPTSGLDHLIVNGTNELNQGRIDQILPKATQAEITRFSSKGSGFNFHW